jgi:hypothetical protein
MLQIIAREDGGCLWTLVSQYEHPEVVRRLMDEEGWGQEEANEAFEDTKRFLYLCSLKRELAPTERIDKGWHAFILYTKDYAAFCDAFFGRFIHHQPVLKLSPQAPKNQLLGKTAKFAREVFGTLSKNWNFGNLSCHDEKCGSDSPDGCQAGDISAAAIGYSKSDCVKEKCNPAAAACSKSDCTPVACDHRYPL